ncbi:MULTISPECIES: sugar transferase [Paenibacillus]|uniref:Sugar transferase n=1 Tax=Paenibacillus residui TaxID=629724 RepID=A0ABW3DBH0_9BACL
MEGIITKSSTEAQSSVELSRPYGFYCSIIKPALDWTAGLLLLPVVAPLLLLLCLLIKLESEGPALFRQKRVGKDGKVFTIYKLRTMYTHVPKEGRSPESTDDPRITKVGKWIRKTSLDELPQLLNILRGEMSFVGPRPEQLSIVQDAYGEKERQRFLVKPGITGLWQTSADRKAPIHHNLHHDFTYIQNISWRMDVYILLRTALVMLKSNTY